MMLRAGLVLGLVMLLMLVPERVLERLRRPIASIQPRPLGRPLAISRATVIGFSEIDDCILVRAGINCRIGVRGRVEVG